MYDCVHLVFVVAVVMFLYITWRWLPMRVYRCVEYSVDGVGTTVGPASSAGVRAGRCLVDSIPPSSSPTPP